jgi:hypothetical protein
MSFSADTTEAFAVLAAAADCLRETDPDHPLLWEFERLPDLQQRWNTLAKKWPRIFAGPNHRDTENQVVAVLEEFQVFADRVAGAAPRHFPSSCAEDARQAAETISSAAGDRIEQIRSIPDELASLRSVHVKAIQDLARSSQVRLRDHSYADAAEALEQLLDEVSGQLSQVRSFMEKEPVRL